MSSLITSPSTVTVASDFAVKKEQRLSLIKNLRRAVWLPAQLDVLLMKADVIARPAYASGKVEEKRDEDAVVGILGANEKNPVHFGAMSAAERLSKTLEDWTANISAARGIPVVLPLTIPSSPDKNGKRSRVKLPSQTSQLAVWILSEGNIEWLSKTPLLEDAAREIGRAVGHAVNVIDLPEDREVVTGTHGADWTTIREDVLESWSSPAAIVKGLSGYKMANLTAKKIATWGDDGLVDRRPVLSALTHPETGEVTIVTDGYVYYIRSVVEKWDEARLKAERLKARKEAKAKLAVMKAAEEVMKATELLIVEEAGEVLAEVIALRPKTVTVTVTVEDEEVAA
jgi:hypothetical protein